MARYTKDLFKQERNRLMEIAGNRLGYLCCDPFTYRVTFGDEVLNLFIDVYLSRRTVIVRQTGLQPRYYRKQTWEQISDMFNNIARYLT